MNTRDLSVCAAVVTALLLAAADASAASLAIDSGAFSVGFGYTVDNNSNFDTTETSAANTPTTAAHNVPFTVGNFQITIGVSTIFFGSNGPRFDDREFTNGDGAGRSAASNGTTVTITATYVGPPLPQDAIPGSDAFELKIDQFSVYFMKHTAYLTADPLDDDTGFYAVETTASNPGQSQTLTATASTFLADASNYQKLSWNPGDFLAPGAISVTRTFSFRPGDFALDPAGVFAIDGIEIIGSANLQYLVPEPTSLALLAMGGMLLSRRRRR